MVAIGVKETRYSQKVKRKCLDGWTVRQRPCHLVVFTPTLPLYDDLRLIDHLYSSTQHVILYPHYIHIDLFQGHDLLPLGEQRKDLMYLVPFHMSAVQPISVSNNQVIYYLWGSICEVGCPVTGRQTGGHLGSYNKTTCSQANMLAPFIKRLKMTGLTDWSMYDHTITGVIVCWCGGVGALLAQTSLGQIER